MKRYIYAMAISKKDAIHQLQGISDPLTEHLVKIYLFPDSSYREHWCKEIRNFLSRVPKLKNGNKLPSKTLVKESISIYLDRLDSMIGSVIKEYPDLNPERFDAVELENMIEEYFDWICEKVCNDEYVSSYDVMDRLKEIGF